MQPITPVDVDVLEAGSGPLVVLVHSSVAGARQWRKLMEALAPSFHVKAVNLFGYGRTPPWTAGRPQSLDDQAALVEAAIPDGVSGIGLVGHSFGGAVAMKAALHLGPRVEKLVLLEPNPFHLLCDHGRTEAFAEIASLGMVLRAHAGRGDWEAAAELFADYWGGDGTWAATSPERRGTFAEALKPNLHEWDAIMNETVPLDTWVERLPARTLIVSDPATVRPIREIVELLRGATPWQFETTSGGHMAPLTRPELVNPIVERFLRAPAS